MCLKVLHLGRACEDQVIRATNRNKNQLQNQKYVLTRRSVNRADDAKKYRQFLLLSSRMVHFYFAAIEKPGNEMHLGINLKVQIVTS